MKKLTAIFLLILLLTACGKQPALEVPDEDPAAAETELPEQEVVEYPVEILPGNGWTVTCETLTREGLVEDAVAYIYEYPSVAGEAGAAAINGFYEELMDQLETYAKDKVWGAAQEKHTVANVTGTYALGDVTEETIAIDYTVEVVFGDGSEPELHQRNDVFDRTTGEKTES